MKLKLNLIALVFLVFAIGEGPSSWAAPPKDACAMLTPAQVGAALGVPVASRALGPKVCVWAQTGVKPGSPRRSAELVLLMMQGYTGGYAYAKMPNSMTTATAVHGVGDDAYYLAMTSGQHMELRVKKGSVAFGILVQRASGGFTAEQVKAKEKTLAQDILARM